MFATEPESAVLALEGAYRGSFFLGRGCIERNRSTPVGEECWGDWSGAVDVPVRAGSIVVFTSLTPHATKRNTTDDVRKAYIVQYAPDGAVAQFGDPASGPPTRTERLGDDERRYWIVRDGARVEPSEMHRAGRR